MTLVLEKEKILNLLNDPRIRKRKIPKFIE